MDGKDYERRFRHDREEAWKRAFGRRLTKIMQDNRVSMEYAADLAECSEERLQDLMDGKEFPTVQECMRLRFLAYDGLEVLYGIKEY